MHFALQEAYGGNPALKIIGVRSTKTIGVRATLISNQRGLKA
jgi:hypothetical protein